MNDESSRALLTDAAKDQLPENFSEETLSLTLAYVQRRRRRRTVIKTAAYSLSVVLFMTGLLMTGRMSERPSADKVAFVPTRTPDIKPVASPRPPIRELTDAELFAKFPGRKMAIVGSGNSKVFLFVE